MTRTLADLLNLLYEKVHPWHPVRIVTFGHTLTYDVIAVTIGGVPCELHSNFPYVVNRSKNDFLERINAILDGAVRDDDGNLVKRG